MPRRRRSGCSRRGVRRPRRPAAVASADAGSRSPRPSRAPGPGPSRQRGVRGRELGGELLPDGVVGDRVLAGGERGAGALGEGGQLGAGVGAHGRRLHARRRRRPATRRASTSATCASCASAARSSAAAAAATVSSCSVHAHAPPAPPTTRTAVTAATMLRDGRRMGELRGWRTVGSDRRQGSRSRRVVPFAGRRAHDGQGQRLPGPSARTPKRPRAPRGPGRRGPPHRRDGGDRRAPRPSGGTDGGALKNATRRADPAPMSDVRPTLSLPASGPHGTVPGVRPLTPEELGHLERARAHLRSSGADLARPAGRRRAPALGADALGRRTAHRRPAGDGHGARRRRRRPRRRPGPGRPLGPAHGPDALPRGRVGLRRGCGTAADRRRRALADRVHARLGRGVRHRRRRPPVGRRRPRAARPADAGARPLPRPAARGPDVPALAADVGGAAALEPSFHAAARRTTGRGRGDRPARAGRRRRRPGSRFGPRRPCGGTGSPVGLARPAGRDAAGSHPRRPPVTRRRRPRRTSPWARSTTRSRRPWRASTPRPRSPWSTAVRPRATRCGGSTRTRRPRRGSGCGPPGPTAPPSPGSGAFPATRRTPAPSGPVRCWWRRPTPALRASSSPTGTRPPSAEGEGRARPARAVGEPLVLGQGAPLL